MLNKKNKLAVRILVVAIGLTLSGVGVGILLYSYLGADPASVFYQGLINVLQLRYAYIAAIFNIVILSVVLLIDRKYVNIASIMAIFLIGISADLTSVALTHVFSAQLNVVVRGGMVVIGCAIMSLGIATYIHADLGVGAIDLISEIISEKRRLPYRWVRVACDIIFVAVGFSLGGVFGIGTLLVAFLTGPLVQFFRCFVYRIIDPLLTV